MQRFQEESINTHLGKFSEDEDEEFVESIYTNYVRAMRKRRPGSELDFWRFYTYVTTKAYFFNYKNSYVFGIITHNNFVPTHFAPAGLKEGIELIKQLRMFDNVVFVVTPDLSAMLQKLNFKAVPLKVQKEFRGDLVDKLLLSSNWLKTMWNELKGSFMDKTYVLYKYLRNKKYGMFRGIDKIKRKFQSQIDKDSYIDWDALEQNLYRDN